MASKKDIPETMVALPLRDGRVELTVVGDEIWISDYAKSGSRERLNFTLVIPRGKLVGNAAARESAFEHHRMDDYAGKAPPMRSARLAACAARVGKVKPRKAGYWYEDSAFPAHGGPVVILEQ
jgi:hypothetical protein